MQNVFPLLQELLKTLDKLLGVDLCGPGVGPLRHFAVEVRVVHALSEIVEILFLIHKEMKREPVDVPLREVLWGQVRCGTAGEYILRHCFCLS